MGPAQFYTQSAQRPDIPQPRLELPAAINRLLLRLAAHPCLPLPIVLPRQPAPRLSFGSAEAAAAWHNFCSLGLHLPSRLVPE